MQSFAVRRAILTGSLCLMMNGCADAVPPPAVLVQPRAVDLAPLRCPEPDPKIAAEWKSGWQRPKPRQCRDGQGLCREDVRAYLDNLEASIDRKNAAGAQLSREYEACRGKAHTS